MILAPRYLPRLASTIGLFTRYGLADFAKQQGLDGLGHEPGTGRIDFPPLWTLLDKAGYAGFVAAEYRPSGDTQSSVGWLDAWRPKLVRTRDSR